MLSLLETLKAWKTLNFTRVFKQELAELDKNLLPLQQGLTYSNAVSDKKISAIINKTRETDTNLQIYSSIFYYGIITGCSCSDDPTPLDTQNEHCELLFIIDKSTASTSVSLISG